MHGVGMSNSKVFNSAAEAGDAPVVGDSGEILRTGVAQGLDQGFGDAAEAETADREGLAIGD